jgi:GDPmannose 4,6-dehydratase
MKSALITGITGQDGSYLAELLLEKGYVVHGVIRRASSFNTGRIDHLYRDPHDLVTKMFLHFADLSDASGLRDVLDRSHPDEVYHLGAQSHVKVSFEQPVYTADITALGTLRLLEAIRDYQTRHGISVRYYQASSSEMFGSTPPPQSVHTPFHPRSPYGCSKVFAFWQTVNHREAYGLHASNGILFNHESPRRGETFVTRKITRAVGRIKMGLQDKLFLGNLGAKRDWGHARDYVDAMWRMLQQDEPGDYVVATGEMHSVQEFADRAFELADLDAREFIEVDRRYLRPSEVDALRGDADETYQKLDWRPRTTFDDLVREMLEYDMELARRERLLIDHGHSDAMIV